MYPYYLWMHGTVQHAPILFMDAWDSPTCTHIIYGCMGQSNMHPYYLWMHELVQHVTAVSK